MTQVYEALLIHTGAGDSTGGVDTNRNGTLVVGRATEMDQEHWQIGKTYESYVRSYIKLEKS